MIPFPCAPGMRQFIDTEGVQEQREEERGVAVSGQSSVWNDEEVLETDNTMNGLNASVLHTQTWWKCFM